jgi:predicted nuclease of predicted toxin-antitoxin system
VRLKLDENIGRSGIEFLRQRGHDVATIYEERLAGAADAVVFEACIAEARTLITLDRDFGQVLRFPPSRTAGIVILEIGAPASVDRLLGRLGDFLALAARRAVHGELWIIEPGRVRVHLAKGED